MALGGLCQCLGGVANFPFTGEKHQDVTVWFSAEFHHGIAYGIEFVPVLGLVGPVLRAGFDIDHRPVAHFDWIGAA